MSAKLNASGSDVDEVFKSMHQSTITKMKNSSSKDLIVETILKYRIKIFEC